jgi:thiosulfate reductase cytochrome b subunit
MSPAFVSAFPFVVDVLGGQQSARTLHFFIAWSLMLFVVVHVVMVCRTGFKRNMRGMISGVERP